LGGGGDGVFSFVVVLIIKKDSICRIPSKRRKFEVRSSYQALSILACSLFSRKSIWRVKALSRVGFFVRTETIGKILTLDNLRKRKVIVWKGVVCVIGVESP
jgi:hypothetical protein